MGCRIVFISRNAQIYSGRSASAIVQPVETSVRHAVRPVPELHDEVRGGDLGGTLLRVPSPLGSEDRLQSGN
jgi:hypothetical protein